MAIDNGYCWIKRINSLQGNSGFGLTYGGHLGNFADFVWTASGKSSDSDVKATTGASTMSVGVAMDMNH